MADIIGTIINVNDFLSQRETNVKISKGATDEIAFTLMANRVYIIPDFQREIKWEKENLIELMKDIENRPKFLGNVILSQSTDAKYVVIDGQQRISVLLMLINYIKKIYSQELTDIPEFCNLNIESFSEYMKFANNNYSYVGLNDEAKIQIEESDIYKQSITYTELYQSIKEVDILNTSTKARSFINNLLECEFNVMLSKENSLNSSIIHFLDVNLKGVKLDTEDIFKAYLYNYDKGIEIRTKWSCFRKLVFKYNHICQSIKKNAKKEHSYPLTKILNHYFYCDLYISYSCYSKLEFNDDFLISKEFKNMKGEKFYKGEHLIKVINDNTYMKKSIDSACKLLEIFIDIVENETPSLSFKSLLTGKGIAFDNNEVQVIYNFIRKLLLDDNLIPKALIMKYILSTWMSTETVGKKEVQYIYTIYFLAVLFSIFENKKGKEAVLSVLKTKNWQEAALTQISNYLSNSSGHSITAQFKYSTNPDDEDQRYRAISLATIFNFFEITQSGIRIKQNTISSIKNYISNPTDYSVEHFIINDGKLFAFTLDNMSETQIKYNYLKETKKYAKSIFNYIFISESLNQDLGVLALHDKIDLVNSKNEVKCEYSKMVIAKASKCFKKINLSIDYKDDLNRYYSYDFIGEHSEFVREIVGEFFKKFSSK